MSTLVGGLALVVAAVAGVIGVGWLLLDAVGMEWDYCPGGTDCIAGWIMGTMFAGVAAVAGIVGASLLRRKRHGSRSGEGLT